VEVGVQCRSRTNHCRGWARDTRSGSARPLHSGRCKRGETRHGWRAGPDAERRKAETRHDERSGPNTAKSLRRATAVLTIQRRRRLTCTRMVVYPVAHGVLDSLPGGITPEERLGPRQRTQPDELHSGLKFGQPTRHFRSATLCVVSSHDPRTLGHLLHVLGSPMRRYQFVCRAELVEAKLGKALR
jgi:hypothetical protein